MKAVFLALALACPAGAETLICDSDPAADAQPASSNTVTVADALGPSPVMTGATGPLPVTLFQRGSTWVFDARSEALYYDRDTHRFAYMRITDKPALMWRGTCRMDG